jgi:DNA-binding GntR family transcriptional regulator
MSLKHGFSQIKLASLNNECYTRIKDAILTGQFSWGERLEVGRFAKEFGISKFPVIKALDRLAIEHLVDILPNKGTFVTSPVVRDVEEVTEIRIALEELAFDLVCQKNRVKLLTLLETIESNIAPYLLTHFSQAHGYIEFLKYDRNFHRCFILCSENERLLDYYEVIRSQVELFNQKTFFEENIKTAIAAHKKITELLKQNIIDEARGVLRAHLKQAHNDTISALYTSSQHE